ncbi:reverse transcriptase domain-containing protein [Tanacetum coccineum]
MTKQGNFTQRTPQAKKQSDQTSRQISKQASESANAPYDLVFTAMGPPLGTTQTTATITSTEGLQRATFTTPPQTVPGTNTTEPPPPPLRNKGPELGADNLTLEGGPRLTGASDFARLKLRSGGAKYLHRAPKGKGADIGMTVDLQYSVEFGKKVSGTQTGCCRTGTLHETMTAHQHSVIGWAVGKRWNGSAILPRRSLMGLKSCEWHPLNFYSKEEVCNNLSSLPGDNSARGVTSATEAPPPIAEKVLLKQQVTGNVQGDKSIDQSSCRTNSYLRRCQNFPRATTNALSEEQRSGERGLILEAEKLSKKVSQKFFAWTLSSLFPTLTADHRVGGALYIEINAAGHDIHAYHHCIHGIIGRPGISAIRAVAIHPDYPEQEVSIGGSLSDTGRAAVCALLQRNLDIFAWEPKHMTGVPRSITEHKLKIRQGYSPVRQKKRGQALERAKAILEEVHKLVEAGIMREVYYHDWLSNPLWFNRAMVAGGCAWTSLNLNNAGMFPRILDRTCRHQAVSRKKQKLSSNSFTEHDERSQSLNGKLGLFEQVLSKSADKVTPLGQNTQDVYGRRRLRWTTEVEKLSTRSSAYSSTSHDNRDSVQIPVYFVSKALKETEINYSEMEKLILALVFAAKRLRRYFQAHPIVVLTDQPIKQSEVKLQEPWILFTDGSSCVDGSGAGLILTNPEGMEFTYALRFEFTATNNEAEYEALIAGLRIAARWVSVGSNLEEPYPLGDGDIPVIEEQDLSG